MDHVNLDVKGTQQPYKILSIDGGGTKVAYSIKFLALIEEHYAIEPIGMHFDLLAGTSAGALSACLLAKGVSAKETLSILQNNKDIMFPPRSGPSRWYLKIRQLFTHKHSNNTLKQLLQTQFGDMKMKDLQKRVILTAIDLNHDVPYIIKNQTEQLQLNAETQTCGPQTEKLLRDPETLVVDAILASSAASTYMPSHTIANHTLVDGGLCANNPSMVAFIDYLRNESNTRPLYKLLSLGNVTHRHSDSLAPSHSGIIRSMGNVVNTAMTTQACLAANLTRILIYSLNSSTHLRGTYLRFENFDSISYDLDDNKNFDLFIAKATHDFINRGNTATLDNILEKNDPESQQ